MEVDETVNLGALEGIQAFIADRVTTERSLRLDVQVGDCFDAHATSIGKALLSLHRPAEVRSIYEPGPLQAHTGDMAKTAAGLLRELASVRKRGYAVNDEELEPGVRSIAVPMLSSENRAVCAIAVIGPKARPTDDRMDRLSAKSKETSARIIDHFVINSSP